MRRDTGPMSEPIAAVIDTWHEFLRGARPDALDELLDDDVVFHSPIVFTPQRGKAITTLYLTAATQALPGDAPLMVGIRSKTRVTAAVFEAVPRLVALGVKRRYDREVGLGDEALDLSVTVSQPADLERLQDVVARHLVRFAFREDMQIEWRPA